MHFQEPAVNLKLSLIALAAASALCAPAAFGANPELKLPNFSHLHGVASDSTDITIDGFLLRIAKKFAQVDHGMDPQGAAAMELIQDIKSVRVRNFTFDTDNAYSRADIESVRKQLRAPGWSSLVTVHKRNGAEDVDVYVCLEGEKIMGLAVIASEPREFTIVNIVGSIDLARISQLGGEFGIPELDENETVENKSSENL
jgi:hypothetical protein